MGRSKHQGPKKVDKNQGFNHQGFSDASTTPGNIKDAPRDWPMHVLDPKEERHFPPKRGRCAFDLINPESVDKSVMRVKRDGMGTFNLGMLLPLLNDAALQADLPLLQVRRQSLNNKRLHA